MQRPFSICLLVLAMAGAPTLAQSVEQDLPPSKSLEIALWGTDLSIILRPGATPGLKAHAVTVEEGAEAVPAAGPTVELRAKGSALRILRAAESKAVRLRVEVTLDVAQKVKVIGNDLDVTVEAPPLDFREMAMLRRMAMERGEQQTTPTWTDVSLALESSRADVSGVAGAVLEGRDTWFVVRQSANQLTVKLEGGAAELREHRGKLRLEGQGGEIKLGNAMGEISILLEGTSLDISDAEGKLEGQARGGAALRLYDWGGHLEVESFGSSLELRNFRPGSQVLKVLAESSEVTVEALESGQLDLDLKGGRLRVRDVSGKMKITAGQETEVELARLRGAWKGIFDNSTITAEEIERFEVELTEADLRLEGAADLRLTANGSEIDASEVRQISRALLVDTRADFDLSEGSRAKVETRGRSQVFVRMRIPCFVITPAARRGTNGAVVKNSEVAPGLDVSGCTAGGNVGNGDQGEERASPSFLTLTVGEEAELDVRGI